METQGEPTNRLTNQPTNQTTDPPTKQPTNQPTHRPTNRSTDRQQVFYIASFAYRPTEQATEHRVGVIENV